MGADQLRSLLDANRSIVAELSLAAVLRRVVDAARTIGQAQYAALGVTGSDGQLEHFVHAGMDADTVEAIGDPPRGHGLLGALIGAQEPIRLRAISDDHRSAGFPPGHPPMQTFLGVPIQSRGESYGTLYLTNRLDGGDFTPEDEQLIIAVAATASIAIENARLYEESRRRQEWLRASADISRNLLLADATTTDTLTRIADTVRRLAAADIVTVVFPDADATRLHVQVARGQHADELLGFSYPAADSLAGEAIADARGLLLDPDHGHYFVHLQSAFNVGPVMACPLVGNAGVRGAVVVGRLAGSRSFTAEDLDMAEAFASHAAVALELADRRDDQHRLQVLEDRHRIARDLHDHVIQRLFAVGLNVQTAASGSTDPVLRDRLRESVDNIDDTIRQIRSTIFELQEQRCSDPRTPRAALLSIATDVEPALGFVPEVSFTGPVDTVVHPELLHDVEAVLREGLINAAKHAEPTHVTACLRVSAHMIIVEINDDGTEPLTDDRRSGLANLQQRASQRNGDLTLTHSTEGTTLRWTAHLIS